MSTASQGARDRLAFALDVPDAGQARAWAERLRGRVGVLKIGLELFVTAGPDVIAFARDAGARVFLDLKLHDIPETVGRAVAAAKRHGVDYLTVHAAGGPAMLDRAVAAASDGGGKPLTILAVTVLTSMDDAQVSAVGLAGGVGQAAERLGALAVASGAGGLVCSAREVAALRARFPKAVLVTPGIRPAGADHGDQSRVATASEAIRAGADILVVGRPIRDAADPLAVIDALVEEIETAAR